MDLHQLCKLDCRLLRPLLFCVCVCVCPSVCVCVCVCVCVLLLANFHKAVACKNKFFIHVWV